MSVKGNQREVSERKLYVGLTSVDLRAFNPSKKELNKLLGSDGKETDQEILYSSQDNEGNERQRMTFWLYGEKVKQYFVHSFLLINKDRVNKDGTKVQVINTTCDTTWVPFKEGTKEADLSFLPDWFKNFYEEKQENGEKVKVIVGKKGVRKALVGEEELATLLKAWLGKLKWMDKDTEVFIDPSKLFKEKYVEIRELINGNFCTPFVALVGVRTDENDATKKYQQVYPKAFLPDNIMKFINNGFVFPADKDGKPNYLKKQWNKFKDEVEGEYGANFFVDLCPIKEYDDREDIASSPKTKNVNATSSEY